MQNIHLQIPWIFIECQKGCNENGWFKNRIYKKKTENVKGNRIAIFKQLLEACHDRSGY